MTAVAEDIPALIAERKSRTERLLVTIDGPCASGKTTLAQKLSEALGAPVVHTDDFVVPHMQKTEERLAVPGGNCDAERLAREVIVPWKQGNAATVRKYDCHTDRMLPGEPLPDSSLLILEGSYSNLPVIRKYAEVRLFMDAPWEIRKARLLRRESPESFRMFQEWWIPLEDRYFRALGLPDPDCTVVFQK